MPSIRLTKAQKAKRDIEQAFLRQTAKLAQRERQEVVICHKHDFRFDVSDGRQAPPKGEGSCPFCQQDNLRTRNEPAPELRKIEPPELAPMPVWLERQWEKIQEAQSGPLPGSYEETLAIEAADAARDDALAAEKARKSGGVRGGRYVTQRIEAGQVVTFWKVPGRKGLVEMRP